MADDHQIPLPRSPELRTELARWEWMPEAWADLPADSRHRYDDWVLSSGSPRQAHRRAQAVARRSYSGRPWAERPMRMLQAVKDQVQKSPEGPSDPGTMAGG